MQIIKLTFHQNLHERNFINVEDLNSFKISLKKHYFKKKSSQMSSSSLREAMFSALQSCFQVDQDKDLKIVISREGVRSGGTGLPCTLRVLLVFPVIGPGSLTTDTTVVTT